MVKIAPISNITAGYASAAKINDSFDKVEAAFNNTLSRDGSSPNSMSADLDLNFNDILNAAFVTADTIRAGTLVVAGLTQTPGSMVSTSAEIVVETVASMKLVTSLVAGNKVRTLGYYTPYDNGGGEYIVTTVAAHGTPDGYGDHLLDNGLVAELIILGNVIACEQYGAADGVESSARIQAANTDALAINTENVTGTLLTMRCSPTAKDQIIIGGSGASRFNVDFSASVITAVTGGNIGVSTPLLMIRIKNSLFELPKLYLNKLSAGFYYENISGSLMSNGGADRFIGYGHKQFGEQSGNSVLENLSGVEWTQSDPEFSVEAEHLYDTVIIDCADSIMIGGRIGQARRNIYLGPDCANTRLIGVHPYNGNPLYADPGVVVKVEPICLENDSLSKVYAFDCYFDNGYIYDNTSRMNITGGFHLILTNRVNMTVPYVRVVAGDDASDDRFTSKAFRSSVGFYAIDHTTPDANYTWLDANSADLQRSGSINNVGGQFNHVVTASNVYPHFHYVKRGTNEMWERYVTNQGTTPADDIIDVYTGGGLIKSNAAFRTTGQRPIGYAAGSGAAIVVQPTSRTTSITCNTPTGAFQLFSAAGSATRTTFQVNCDLIEEVDTVQVTQRDGTNHYRIDVTRTYGNSFVVSFTTDGVATDAPIFNYTILKGQTS